MKVYIASYEDNLSSESTNGITGVYKNIQDARDKIKENYKKEIENIKRKDCDSIFYEYTEVVEDDYWEIRSTFDEFYYMSESVETYELL